MNSFDRVTFETSEFLIESIEAPKIKAGGSSSSNILNRYFEATTKDLSLLVTRTNALAARSTRMENLASQQAAALQASLTSLSSRVDAASAYTQVLADMHSSFYVNGTTTATINEVFGQATLPVRSSTNLLVQEDVYGQKYVSSEIELSYATSSAVTPASVSADLFQTDIEGIFMLRDEQTWLVVSPTSSGQYLHFKIKAPLQFKGLQPNVLEVWPLPAFGTELMGVYYQKADDPTAGTWYTLDMTYCPGYSTTTGTVPKFSPIRLILPSNTTISQLVIVVNPNDTTYCGMKSIALLHNEYETSAILAVKDPYSRTINSTILRGKDTSDLSQLTVTRSTNVATINMTTDDSTSTPVITGVIMAV